MNSLFIDRTDAGHRLAKALPPIDRENALILALPRGGVPVAAAMHADTGIPVDLLFVRKIGLPADREVAVGAVVDGEEMQIVVNRAVAERFGISFERITELAKDATREIERYRSAYKGNRRPHSLEGKAVILVDDGIATGASMRAAVTAVRRRHAKSIHIAVPVSARSVVKCLGSMVDSFTSLYTPDPFMAVSLCYRNFHQLGDEEVIGLIEEMEDRPSASRQHGVSVTL